MQAKKKKDETEGTPPAPVQELTFKEKMHLLFVNLSGQFPGPIGVKEVSNQFAPNGGPWYQFALQGKVFLVGERAVLLEVRAKCARPFYVEPARASARSLGLTVFTDKSYTNLKPYASEVEMHPSTMEQVQDLVGLLASAVIAPVTESTSPSP